MDRKTWINLLTHHGVVEYGSNKDRRFSSDSEASNIEVPEVKQYLPTIDSRMRSTMGMLTNRGRT